MSKLTARNLGLISLTALLFVGLALSLSETLQPVTPSVGPINGLQPDAANDMPQVQKFTLRLDKTLLTPITSTPNSAPSNTDSVLAPLTSRALRLRDPEFRKPLLFLAGALTLGLLSGVGFSRRTRVTHEAADQVRSDLSSVSPPQVAMDDGELAKENLELNSEVQSLRENLQSYVGVSEFAETLQLQQQEVTQENQNLHTQIETLQSELQIAVDASKTTAKLREQLEQAQQQNGHLEAEIQTLNNSVHQYSVAAEDTEQLQKLQEQTSDKNSELLAEVQTLRDNLHSYENEISNTENRLKDHEITIEELRDELLAADKLESALQSIKQKQQTLRDEVSERDEIISNLHADIDNWRDQCAGQEEHAIEVNDQLMLVREEKERSERDLQASEELISELQQAKETLIKQIDQLEPRAAMADDLGVQISDLEKSSQRLQGEHEHLQNTLLETQVVADESTHLQSRLKSLIEDLEFAENAHAEAEQQIQLMQQQSHDLELSNSDKDSQLSQLSTTIDEHNGTISGLSEEIESSQEQLAQATQTHQALLLDKQTLTDNYENLGREQQQLENELKTLKTILEDTEQSNIELSESIVLLREDLTDMANQVNERNGTINDGKKQLAVEMHHAAAREETIDGLNAQLASDAQRIESMSEATAQAALSEERLSNWDNSLQTYRNDINQKNSLIDQLHDAIRINNIRNDALKSQIRSMDEQMEILSIVHEEVAEVTEKLSHIDEQLGAQDTGISALSLDTTAQYEKIASLDHSLGQIQQEKTNLHMQFEESAKATAELQDEVLDNQQTFLNLGRVLDHTMQSAEIENGADEIRQSDDLAAQLLQKTQTVSDHLSGSLHAIQITIDEHNILQSKFDEQVELNERQRIESEKAQQELNELNREIENKQSAIAAQVSEHEADVEQHSVQQAELENKIVELNATLTSDQTAFAARQNELQQQIEEHIERASRKEQEFGEQLLNTEQAAQHTLQQQIEAHTERENRKEQEFGEQLLNTEQAAQHALQQQIEAHTEHESRKELEFGEQLLNTEQAAQQALQQQNEEHIERASRKEQEFDEQLLNVEQAAQHTSALLESEREKLSARETELQRLNELLVSEQAAFSALQQETEQQLSTLRSSKETLQNANEKQLIEHQTNIHELEQEVLALEARIESNQDEFTQSLKTNTEQLRDELESQRDALMQKSHASHQQLTGELLEQKEANTRLQKEIEEQREQIRHLKPTAQALPVLRNLVAGRSKVDRVPVLRQPKNDKD